MNGLENFEPFDNLEEWSDNVELFMDAMAKPTEHADALLELAKLKKKEKPRPQNNPVTQSMINPGLRSLRG